MNVLELRQKRANLISQARAVVDEADKAKRGLTAEEDAQYSKLIEETNKLADEIKRREQLEAMETDLGELRSRAIKPEVKSEADIWKELFPYTDLSEDLNPRQMARVTPEYRKSWNTFMRRGFNALDGKEVRALQADSDVAGGYLVPPIQFVQGLIKTIDNLVFVRQLSTVTQVLNAESLGVVSLDNDPADPAWTAEIAIGTEDSTMTFGRRELHPHPLGKYIKVSRKLLRQVPEVEGLVLQRLGYKFGTTQENAFLNGSGANQPLGVFTASALGVSTGRDVSTGNTTTSMTFDGLTEAKYKLPQQYWGGCVWIFHRDGAKQIAKLKDGEGNYIWRESVRAGEPDRLLNYPVYMSEYAPSTFTTGLYVGILGNFRLGYHIADALSMEMQRLDELYAATNQVGFIGRMESDGMPVLEEAFARVKLA